MLERLIRCSVLSLFGLLALAPRAFAAPWIPVGPYGGDARAIAADPRDSRHLFLGTENGWIYQSVDGGYNWRRLAQLDRRNDMVIDHILVDPSNPQRLLAGAWVIDHPDGGLYISADGGHSWYSQAQMHGQSIRSMTRGISNPHEVIAGTLKGVFRSDDDGLHWTQISPLGSAEIHEIESVAVDPTNSNVIYAGTWHLPWKTTDGGRNWVNIKEGIIDDSDVFSIIVDPTHPNVVYASACSGIYKSTTTAEPNPLDQGKRFKKVNGIPTTARRTRKLAQDPNQPGTVFAGTTEGLYRTMDAGRTWERLTGGDVIVNDVFIDPTNSSRVLLATDRGGVLRSEDGGATFEASNEGFSLRQVVAYAADPQNPATVFIGVVNDKAAGGAFESTDGGVHYTQIAAGLGGRDVFSLMTAPGGVVLAGTPHGIYRFENGLWAESDAVANLPPAKSKTASPARVASKATSSRGRKTSHSTATKKPAPAPIKKTLPKKLDEVIYAFASTGDTFYAATTLGLVRSTDQGHVWSGVNSLTMPEMHFISVHDKVIFAGSLRRLALSVDNGDTWDPVALPTEVTQVSALCVDEAGNLWVGGREGVYYSTDYGENWKTLKNLFMTQVDNIFFDPASHRVLLTSTISPFAFAVHIPDYRLEYWDTGWRLRMMRPVGDHFVGATLYDGMVVQPRMVDSKFQ